MSLFIPLASIPAQSKKSIQGVIEFSLVNANTKAVIATIKDGDIIDLAQLSTSNLNILAVTSPDSVGSVKFTLTGKESRTFIENEAPYLLYGDANNVYNAWTPTVGTYKLTALPYTAPGTNGLEGYALTVNFEVRNIVTNPNTPELADINALLNYTRGSVTEINVVEPLYGDYFVWLATWPYSYDSVNTYPAKGGGFWQRKNLTEIDLRHCGAFVNREADSLNAWKLAIILAQRYKLPINQEGYNTLLYPVGTTINTPTLTIPDNITIIGNGSIGAKIKNPLDYLEGYRMINWTGANGKYYGTFDGGKDNSVINNTDTSPAILVYWSGNNPGYYGKCINAQGYGVQLTGEGIKGNLLADKNAGYASVSVKMEQNRQSVYFENIISERSPDAGPKARVTCFTLNSAQVEGANGGLGGFFLEDFYCNYMYLKNGTALFEGAVTYPGQEGNAIGFFKNVTFGTFRNTLDKIYTTSGGSPVPWQQTTKVENVENFNIKVLLENYGGMYGIHGIGFSEVQNMPECKKWITNNFNSVMPRGIVNIEEFVFDRTFPQTMASGFLWKLTGNTGNIINIDTLRIKNNNLGQVYTPSFGMFQVKVGTTIKSNIQFNIGQIIVEGSGDVRMNLHNGFSSAEKTAIRKQFNFATPPPASIIW